MLSVLMQLCYNAVSSDFFEHYLNLSFLVNHNNRTSLWFLLLGLKT